MTSDQQNANIHKNNKKKIALITIIVIVSASIAALSYGLLISGQNQPTRGQTTAGSWIVKGAYASYEGQANVISKSIPFNAKMEIMDLNATHLEVLTDFNMSSPFGEVQNTTTTWVNRNNMTSQPEGASLVSTYSTQITLSNLGIRSCTAYEYKNQELTETLYVDNSVQWPVEITMTSPTSYGQSYSMNIYLVDTNIPGL